MRVRFTSVASVQGQGYRPGDEADLSEAVGQVYVRLGQAELIAAELIADEPIAAEPIVATVASETEAAEIEERPKPSRGRKPKRRGGRQIETAADEDRETR
jgi:hypothetical protein